MEVIISQSLSKILVHLVFSTKNRQSWIQPEIEPNLYRYISDICVQHDCTVFQIGGMPDHIHLLLSLGRGITISKLVAEVKSNSSRWIKRFGLGYKEFAWQGGYGAFSISHSHVNAVCHYIAQQKEHHEKVSFKEELIAILNKYQMTWDEKYLWD